MQHRSAEYNNNSMVFEAGASRHNKNGNPEKLAITDVTTVSAANGRLTPASGSGPNAEMA